MLNVMRVDETSVVTTGKRTAFVPGNQGTFDGETRATVAGSECRLIDVDCHQVIIRRVACLLCITRQIPTRHRNKSIGLSGVQW